MASRMNFALAVESASTRSSCQPSPGTAQKSPGTLSEIGITSPAGLMPSDARAASPLVAGIAPSFAAVHRTSDSAGPAAATGPAARATIPCAARAAPASSGSRRVMPRSSRTVCRASASAASGRRAISSITSHDTMAFSARTVAASSVSSSVVDLTLRTSGVIPAHVGVSSLDLAAPLPGGAAPSRAAHVVQSRDRLCRQAVDPASFLSAAYPFHLQHLGSASAVIARSHRGVPRCRKIIPKARKNVPRAVV